MIDKKELLEELNSRRISYGERYSESESQLNNCSDNWEREECASLGAKEDLLEELIKDIEDGDFDKEEK